MSDVSTLDAVVNATLSAQQAPAPVEPEEPETDEQGTEEPVEGQEEKQLNKLLRKAETAFAKGNKGLLLSRVECGRWVHEVYVYRLSQGQRIPERGAGCQRRSARRRGNGHYPGHGR